MSEYRHEYKYVCSTQQLACIRNRIECLMSMDKHVENGKYTIRSLYFDDFENGCFCDNINGTDPREKFRIRIYDGDASFIKLELKQKQREMTRKYSCTLNESICRGIMTGSILRMDEIDSAVYRKFCLLQATKLLAPKVIVEYDRIPYVYRDGNVRVTFDMNIRSGDFTSEFLDRTIVSRPIMSTNKHILEVKFDEYLPDFIYDAIQKEKLQKITFSKYFLCRKYNTGGCIL